DPTIAAPRGSRSESSEDLRSTHGAASDGRLFFHKELAMESSPSALYAQRRHIDSTSVIGTADFTAVSGHHVDEREALDLLQVLNAAIASSLSGIAICDQFGRITLANQALNALFEYGAGELLGCDITSIVPDAALLDAYCVRDLDGRSKDGTLVPIRIGI